MLTLARAKNAFQKQSEKAEMQGLTAAFSLHAIPELLCLKVEHSLPGGSP